MLANRLQRQRQLGLGLVELMVGVTIGLIVAAGASMVAVNQINEHRRLMLETQVQQDLRTAADLLQQDLRRAGFRGSAEAGVWAPSKAAGSFNETGPQLASSSPYSTFTVSASTNTGATATYLYARLDPGSNSYNQSGTPWDNEHFGFKWNKGNGVLYIQLGLSEDGQPNWQPITDPESVVVTDFSIDLSEQPINLGDFCDQSCGFAGGPACPTQKVREVKFKIVGVATHSLKDKDHVVRTLTGAERIRADAIDGACPS